MFLFPSPITTELLTDFFPPSPSERVRFKKHIAALQGEIATLEARITGLNSQINVTKHNLSLARVLPLDVLYEIFDRWLVRDRDAPMTAIRVCRRWREGILAYPQAWRSIDIQPIKHCAERVAFWVKWAGDYALDVRVHIFPEAHPLTFELDLQRHIAFRTAFAELCKTSHCWDHLTVLLCPHHKDYDEYYETTIGTLRSVSHSLNVVKKSPLPRIRSTGQVSSLAGCELHYRDHLLGGTLVSPNSAQKSFVYLGLPLEDNFTSNTLHSVTIGKCSYDSIAQVIGLLSNLPALQVFNMLHLDVEDESAFRDNPYIHHALTEFNLADFGSEYQNNVQLLLGYMMLTLPNLRRLFLSSTHYERRRQDAAHEQDIMIGFLERSRAPLEVLHLPTHLFNDEWLHRIFSLSPQLKCLTIRIRGCSNAVRELLTSFDPTVRVPCPDLEHLTLISCSAEHIDLIHELARTRRQFLEGRSGGETASGVTADTQMMLRPFHSLHVYGPPEMIGRAGEIEEMMPAGTFSFSIEHTDWWTGETPHEIMEQALFPPEWDSDF
ncbi:hypothetical protein HYDPIDRAFT_107779 [Hydnomerulius pinastri MD-312]|nr:hypothetical protein HYDPIDRAFT_107779 [Hydnomerulius pinastri MD-312]